MSPLLVKALRVYCCCFLGDCDGFHMNAPARHVTGFHSHVTWAPPCCRNSSAAARPPSDYCLIRGGGGRVCRATVSVSGRSSHHFEAKSARLYAPLWWFFFPSFKAARAQKMKSSVSVFAWLWICQRVKILAG